MENTNYNFGENQCYFTNFELHKITNDSILSYTILITSLNTIIWIRDKKPNKKSIVVSYLLSLWLRYMFYPIYVIGDTFYLSSNLYKYLNDNNIQIL